MGKRLIELRDVSKEYDGDLALDHVNLYINDGEFLTLLGPSGCGKTTMLRLIAGFIMPTTSTTSPSAFGSRRPPRRRSKRRWRPC